MEVQNRNKKTMKNIKDLFIRNAIKAITSNNSKFGAVAAIAAFAVVLTVPILSLAECPYVFGSITSDGADATAYTTGGDGNPWSWSQYGSASHSTSVVGNTLTFSGSAYASSSLSFYEISSFSGGKNLISYGVAWGSGVWTRDKDCENTRQVHTSLNISGYVYAETRVCKTGGFLNAEAIAYSQAYASVGGFTNKADVRMDMCSTNSRSPVLSGSICPTITYQESDSESGGDCAWGHGYVEWTMTCTADYWVDASHIELAG